MSQADHDPWTDLTWDDLDAWASSVVVQRGRSYQRSGRVIALASRGKGTLVGKVRGTELYMTRVTLDCSSVPVSLSGDCSCPYGINCKHAVAVVLEYLEKVKSGARVADQLPADDSEDEDAVVELWGEEDEDDLDEDAAFALEADIACGDHDEKAVQQYLQSLSKAELIDLATDLATASQAGSLLLESRARGSSEDATTLVRAARAELRRVTAEPGWSHHWSGEGYTPDYGVLKTHLESLLAGGHADAVLELGLQILQEGTQQVGMSDDEGETASAAADCLRPVWKALERSSLDPAQRILWLIDRLLQDEHELCYGCEESDVWEAGPAAWRKVADALLSRLDEAPSEPGPDDGTRLRDYRRDRLVDSVVEALDNAGCADEATELCVREAPITCSYQRAVERLIGEERFTEVKQLAAEGIHRTDAQLPGIADSLLIALRQMADQEGDHTLAAALAARSFLYRPSMDRYCELREAAQAAGLWPDVRRIMLETLTTGVAPSTKEGWPLPDTGLSSEDEAIAREAPLADLLVEIALDEGDHEEALKWHAGLSGGPYWGPQTLSQQVARAVASTHPEEAIAIWRDLAERAISGANRKAYEASLQYLRPMRDLLTSLDRREQWETYLAQLRAANSRRRALQETLDRLARGRIIDQ